MRGKDEKGQKEGKRRNRKGMGMGIGNWELVKKKFRKGRKEERKKEKQIGLSNTQTRRGRPVSQLGNCHCQRWAGHLSHSSSFLNP